MTAPLCIDSLVIGAGPIGLFQVFQLGLLGRSAHVVDALPQAGGQCLALYPDKPIYDIPGLPRCTARELITNLLEQCRPFAPQFFWQQCIQEVQSQADGRFLVSSDLGQQWLCEEVFVAAGVGAFVPRRLSAPGAAQLERRQLHYHPPALSSLYGLKVVVVGDGDEALHTCIELAQQHSADAAHVTLLYRRQVLRGDAHLQAQMQDLCRAGKMQFKVGQISALHATPEALAQLDIVDAAGQTSQEAVHAVIVLQGLSPQLGPLLNWGLNLDRKQVIVDTANFATSVPGVYAVGDINTYPGKRKLIVCGFHEATLAAYAALARHHPEQAALLQYTTSSTVLHQRLGV